MSYAVLLTTFNRLDYTQRTLNSLVPTLSTGTQVVVYDNASTDGTREWIEAFALEKHHIKFTLLWHDTNSGWAHSVNEMVKFVKDDVRDLLIINNDVDNWNPEWYSISSALLEKYPDVGLLAMWSHINHGLLENRGDLIVKDNMPAVAWLIPKARMLPVTEHGPCETKGGNGEDSDYCMKVMAAGWKVAAPIKDLAHHIDWY